MLWFGNGEMFDVFSVRDCGTSYISNQDALV